MTRHAEFLASLKPVSVDDAIAAVDARGYTATPITSGQEVMGYELRGPRNSRKVVELSPDGTISMASIELWFEGIDYTTAKIAARKPKSA